MIVDKLFKKVEEDGNICVGLDSSLDYIPGWLKEKYGDISKIIFQFNKMIIDKTIDVATIYKPQIAFYEAYGIEGLIAYRDTLEYIRDSGAMSLGDIKRGDISSTAKMYGKAHFEGDFEADFITLNPYMGMDSITPYLKYIEEGSKGVFVLTRTSNPGAKDFEYLDVGGEAFYYKVGDKLRDLAKKYKGSSGYSSIGLVVGGTHTDEAVEIRNRYKSMFFLIPGYGAQGAGGRDVNLYLNNGNGGIVNSSRGIITNYKTYEDGEEKFDHYAREAVLNMREDIRDARGL